MNHTLKIILQQTEAEGMNTILEAGFLGTIKGLLCSFSNIT